jgi:hypothetical protein
MTEKTLNILSRADAKRFGNPIYFTGKPCKHGHVAYRYTQSGTCSECINPKSDGTKRETTIEYNARQVTLQAFVELNVTVAPASFLTVKGIIHGLALAHDPSLLESDVWLSPRPTSGVLYRVRCHADDMAQVREVTNRLYADQCVDIERVRQGINATAIAEASKTTPPDLADIVK